MLQLIIPKPQPGAALNYTLTVSVLGPAASTGVRVNDILPSGVQFISATPSVGTYSSTTGEWSIGTLSPNATATLAIATDVNSYAAGETITNTATVAEDAILTNPNAPQTSSSVTVGVMPVPVTTSTADLAVTKIVDNTAPESGMMVHYTVSASDLGPASSTGVMVNDILPAGLTFVSAAPSVGTYDAMSGMWNIGTLSPNATATLVVATTVNSSDTAGEAITNTATINGSSTMSDPNVANNTASANLTVAAIPTITTSTAGLELANVIDNAAPQVGAMVNYQLTASALGPATSTNVVVNDILPAVSRLSLPRRLLELIIP